MLDIYIGSVVVLSAFWILWHVKGLDKAKWRDLFIILTPIINTAFIVLVLVLTVLAIMGGEFDND